ncbi:MAG: Maf family protein [Thiolinea sp.]
MHGLRSSKSGPGRSQVWFRAIHEAEIAAYWQLGEPQDKAGAYAIQGYGALFVERMEGSYSGIMGLPLFETAALLQTAGCTLVRLSALLLTCG